MRAHGFTNLVVGAAMTLAFTVTAQAQNNRSFVATTGDDTNNCTVSAYCRTFAAALAVTNSGGEIVVVNSGGYGAATINRPVEITAIGVDASITATSGNALTINTTGNVTITGLNLYGGGSGNDGVLVQAVGFLRLYSLLIQNFASDGIEFLTNIGNLAVYDSKINDCQFGIYQGGGQAYVSNTEFDNNSYGVISAAGRVTIADSSAHYNTVAFASEIGTIALHDDRVIFNVYGIVAVGGGTLYFADCLISENTNAYLVAVGSTMVGSSPGTSLITPGQMTVGTLSAPIAIE